jgi:hypothetical protein
VRKQVIYRISGNDAPAVTKAAAHLAVQESSGGKIVRLYKNAETLPDPLPVDADVIIITDTRTK